MSGIVITATSGKGGVGKTTTVANLAAALAVSGKRVVVIDADIGLRNLDLVMGLEEHVVYDLFDVVEQRCSLRDALVRDRRADSLWLLAAAQTRDKSDIVPEQMANVCEELRPMVDYILIDSPAGIEHGFQNAIAPADQVLIVTTPDVSALRDADKVIYLLERDWQCQPGLVLNRYNAKLSLTGDMRDVDDVLDILSIDLLGVVPEDEHIVLSSDRGKPVVFAKRLQVKQAYENIAQRIMGNNVPLMRFAQPGLWFSVSRMFGRMGTGL